MPYDMRGCPRTVINSKDEVKLMPSLWFGREFSFAVPVELFPNIIERVRGTPARLEDLLGALQREVSTRRDGARWSRQEHAGHLFDREALEVQPRDAYEQAHEVLMPRDRVQRQT